MTSFGLSYPSDESDRFFNLSPDLLCVIRRAGTFVRVNPAWERTLGFAASELVGTSCFDLIHPDDLARTRALSETVARGNGLSGFENRYRCKDGSYRWLHWSAAPDLEHGLIYEAAAGSRPATGSQGRCRNPSS